MPVEFIHKFVPGTSPATVLALHGTGGDEDDLLPVARALAPGAGLLSPRGRSMDSGMCRFFSRPAADGRFDPDDIRRRADELAEWIGLAVTRYGLDRSRLYALGYSNGANMAGAMMLLHPGSIVGGVLLRPMPVIRPEPLPDLKNAPVLIAAGEQDSVIPRGGGEALGRLLAEAGAAVDFAMQEAGHELTPQDFSMGKKWLGQFLV